MEPTTTHEVEFERQRARTDLPPLIQKTKEQVTRLRRKLLRRARVSRGIFVLLGAVAIAWATQRAGFHLPMALCFFFGALPMLWVGGWLFGLLFQARRTAEHLAATETSTPRQGPETATVVEKVKLSMSSVGLHITRDAQSQVIGWSHVRMNRIGPGGVAIFLAGETGALNDSLMVPHTAFSSDATFDDFCLTMQRFIWEAERQN